MGVEQGKADWMSSQCLPFKYIPVFIGGLLNDVPQVFFDRHIHGVKFLTHLFQRQSVTQILFQTNSGSTKRGSLLTHKAWIRKHFTPCLLKTPGVSFGHLRSRA